MQTPADAHSRADENATRQQQQQQFINNANNNSLKKANHSTTIGIKNNHSVVANDNIFIISPNDSLIISQPLSNQHTTTTTTTSNGSNSSNNNDNNNNNNLPQDYSALNTASLPNYQFDNNGSLLVSPAEGNEHEQQQQQQQQKPLKQQKQQQYQVQHQEQQQQKAIILPFPIDEGDGQHYRLFHHTAIHSYANVSLRAGAEMHVAADDINEGDDVTTPQQPQQQQQQQQYILQFNSPDQVSVYSQDQADENGHSSDLELVDGGIISSTCIVVENPHVNNNHLNTPQQQQQQHKRPPQITPHTARRHRSGLYLLTIIALLVFIIYNITQFVVINYHRDLQEMVRQISQQQQQQQQSPSELPSHDDPSTTLLLINSNQKLKQRLFLDNKYEYSYYTMQNKYFTLKVTALHVKYFQNIFLTSFLLSCFILFVWHKSTDPEQPFRQYQ